MSTISNFVFITGRTGKDPSVRYNDNGTVVASFPIAITEKKQTKTGETKEITTWLDVICWSNLAMAVEKKVKKGNLISLKGKIQNDKWQDKDGKTHLKNYILMDEFIIHSTPQVAKPDYSNEYSFD